jgi:hypothetical protein
MPPIPHFREHYFETYRIFDMEIGRDLSSAEDCYCVASRGVLRRSRGKIYPDRIRCIRQQNDRRPVVACPADR